MDTLGKGVCRCISAEHGDNELEMGHDEILADGLIKKGIKEQNQLEVAIGDGMEFTIHGDMKNNKSKKSKFLNNTTVSSTLRHELCQQWCHFGGWFLNNNLWFETLFF